MFPDHATVHVRDVATAFLTVLDTIHGRLIPPRTPARLDWMRACGVLLAYLHDIGLADSAPNARAMHPEYVARAALGDELGWLADELLAERGFLADRLADLPVARPDQLIREVMALAMGHSKSKVPVAHLNHPPSLAGSLRAATGGAEAAVSRFGWLEAQDESLLALRDDVIDCVRVLRAADALRQRGTVLKTSGGYEIFIDRQNAHAVYALRLKSGRSVLLELPNGHNAAEANLSSSELDPNGNLRLAFHHGRFRDTQTAARAAAEAARLVSDVRQDVIESFRRPDHEISHLAQAFGSARVLVESVDDNEQFVPMIVAALRELDPETAERCHIVPSLNTASRRERLRYLSGIPVAAGRHAEVLGNAAAMGLRVDHIDAEHAFANVHRIALTAGEILIAAGEPSGFVYLPECDGLAGLPLGGYSGFRVRAWALLGATGVVRGAVRNSTVVAEADVSLLAIPGSVYLRHWHRTFDAESLASSMLADVPEPQFDQS